MENCRNKQFVSFKFQVILSNVTKSLANLLVLIQDVNHPYAQFICIIYAAHLLNYLVAFKVIKINCYSTAALKFKTFILFSTVIAPFY